MNSTSFPTEDVLRNPGLLKLELIRWGVRGENLEDQPAPCAHLREIERRVELILPESIWASAPLSRETEATPFILEREEEGKGYLRVAGGKTRGLKVGFAAPPAFHGATTVGGILFSDFCVAHGNFLVMAPLKQTRPGYFNHEFPFCRGNNTDNDIPVETVVEAVKLAKDHWKVGMVILHAGSRDSDDRGIKALEPYIRTIKRTFDVLVAVNGLPPANNSWIDRTYAMGVDSIHYNLEIFDEGTCTALNLESHRLTGRNRFLDALYYATTVFPPGAVVSHLFVGAESIDSTMEGVKTLIESRVIPVLPILTAPIGSAVPDASPKTIIPDTKKLSELYGSLYSQLKRARVPMDWVQRSSSVVTPAEGRFFVKEKGLGGLLKKIAPPGKRMPSSTLSDWRRALRVKEVDDSLKSSGL